MRTNQVQRGPVKEAHRMLKRALTTEACDEEERWSIVVEAEAALQAALKVTPLRSPAAEPPKPHWRKKYPSAAQHAVLENLVKGLRPDSHVAGQSMRGAFTTTMTSLRDRGWIGRDDGITASGQSAWERGARG